jgi:hypothetical protein
VEVIASGVFIDTTNEGERLLVCVRQLPFFNRRAKMMEQMIEAVESTAADPRLRKRQKDNK